LSTPAVVLTTWPVDGDHDAFARTLVAERLAACVNIVAEMQSVYRWEGRIDEARERLVVIKTSRERVAALRERLLQLHPYEVPEFIVVPVVDGSEAYLRWIADSTS
jgi:periplasmic divalent cation tolerance protein